MKIEVELISNEAIKPSSPTLDHLRHYPLSFLDQLCTKHYNPLIFFYELNGDHNIAETSNKIKKSLSEVLTLYYPLAGRVKNDRFVDCNDEGVSYSVARVISKCHLSDAIKNPLPSELCKFLPFELHPLTEFALGVQLNIFEHGGIAVGLCISHQLADALSCVIFAKTWVAVSRGEVDSLPRPEFVSARLFPFMDDPGFKPSANMSKTTLTKRFVFKASALETIRQKYDKEGTECQKRQTSRYEALSAFLSCRFAAAMHDEHSAESKTVYAAILPVNLRPRLDPPLPEYSFGNLSRCGFTTLSFIPGPEEYSYEMVRHIREGIRQVDKGYLEKVQQGEDSHMKFLREYARKLTSEGGQLISFCFSSLCRFPLYEADFGWGEPVWVSSATLCFNNLVAFMDTRTGNGIEAYIALKEEHMAKLEADQDFLESFNSTVGC
ncbi:Transferase [Parasponia andersonii]|uniref:Transferase n=1 Tax=Parasponia andersonii TaxID=3476 RepID=A0A2P5ATA8_PARAD|nr:Transferase [Parasponia andersonii]